MPDQVAAGPSVARHWRWALPAAGAITLADAVTKEIVQATFAYGERVPVTGFFNLVFVMNPGAAFSFLASAGGWQKPLLLGFGVIVSALLVYMLVRQPMHRVAAAGMAAILGGALGNVLDRARHGAVVDWLDFYAAGWHWPAFNFADIGISMGAAALIFEGVFLAPPKKPAQDARR